MVDKYYKLEDLKVGMRVSMGSLSKIYDTRICVDKKTIEYDKDGEVWGDIVYIGNGNFLKEGIKQEEVSVWVFYEDIAGFHSLG